MKAAHNPARRQRSESEQEVQTMKDAQSLGRVTGVFTGRVGTPWKDLEPTAIIKTSRHGPVRVTSGGLDEDEQADLSAHGGPDQAVHHYAAEHLEFWAAKFPEEAGKFKSGCFGENISSIGLTEHNTCIGDVLKIGTATLQVSQGRQPCWKLNAHMQMTDMAFQFRSTARTGWYYRVLEEGEVDVGSQITLQSRPCPGWSIADVTLARFSEHMDIELAGTLAALEPLSAVWRQIFLSRAEG